ncbi:MAG: hypothetical protein R3357_13280 [Burkholderiales bacterium]|nr:hypothetical protein [Burkholderiales bacterium]
MFARLALCSLTAALLLAAPQAGAQGSPLDPQALKLFGGTYSSNCASASATRLQVGTSTISVKAGKRKMQGRNMVSAAGYFGASPPPEYRTALLATVRSQNDLVFIVYQDGSGYYIQVDGDKTVQSTLGKATLAAKHRKCG